MERGLYFDAWIKHNHCYHPSLPLRSEQMLEDLKAYHATTLVWRDSAGEASACRISSTRRGETLIRECVRRHHPGTAAASGSGERI